MTKIGELAHGGVDYLLKIVNESRRAVPAVDYAFGVTGVAAAAAIVVLFLGSWRASFFIVFVMIVAMVVLFGFAQLVKQDNIIVKTGSLAVFVVVTLVFCAWVVMTTTAVAFGWPCRLERLLGTGPGCNGAADDRVEVIDDQPLAQIVTLWEGERAVRLDFRDAANDDQSRMWNFSAISGFDGHATYPSRRDYLGAWCEKNVHCLACQLSPATGPPRVLVMSIRNRDAIRSRYVTDRNGEYERYPVPSDRSTLRPWQLIENDGRRLVYYCAGP